MTSTIPPSTSSGSSTTLPSSQPAAPETSREIASFDEWQKSGLHKVWTHGGVQVVIRIPDLFTLIQEDAIPETLRGAALREIETGSAVGGNTGETGSGVDWDTVKQAAQLYEHIAYQMIVKPPMTIEQFRTLPAEDRDMLRDLAMRQRNTDARGVRLGVEPLEKWATFRDAHRCAPDCTACEEAQRQLSTVGVL